MMLVQNEDTPLRKFRDDSGNTIQGFPSTPASFWFLDSENVDGLLNALRIDHRHCETSDDRLRELGMHIGVHPDSNPHHTNMIKKIDKLLENQTNIRKKLDKLKEKFDKFGENQTNMRKDIHQIREKFDKLEENQANMDKKIDKLLENQTNMEKKVDNIQAILVKILKRLDT